MTRAETCPCRDWCWRLYAGRKRPIADCGYEVRGDVTMCPRYQNWLAEDEAAREKEPQP